MGLLRTAAALPKYSDNLAESFSQWIQKQQPAGSKTGPVVELARGGHIFAALKVRMLAGPNLLVVHAMHKCSMSLSLFAGILACGFLL